MPKSPHYTEELETFQDLMKSRMEDGYREYGDTSFGKSLRSLLQEIQEELVDTANWAFIGYSKLQRIREKLDQAEKEGVE